MPICCQFMCRIQQFVHFVHYYSIQFLCFTSIERFFIVGCEEGDSSRDKHMTNFIGLYLTYYICISKLLS